MHVEHFLDARGGRASARHHDDEVCKHHQREQNLRHIVDERADLALRERAVIDEVAAQIQNEHHAQIDKYIRDGVQKRRNDAQYRLHFHEPRVFLFEIRDLLVLHGKCADDARARKVFARDAVDFVEGALHFAVFGNRDRHDQPDKQPHRHGYAQKDQSHRPIDDKGRDERAEHDERRAQKEPQKAVYALFRLVDIRRDAGNEGGHAERIEFRVRKRIDLFIYRRTQFRAVAVRRLSRIILRDKRTAQPHRRKTAKHERHKIAIHFVAVLYADVDDLRHHDGNDQFQRRFEKLEERGDNRFLFIIF